MTKPPRSALAADLLKRAKVNLEESYRKTDSSCGICYMIAGETLEEIEVVQSIRTYIQNKLDGCMFVGAWLIQQGVAHEDARNSEYIQEYRLAWLDQLIKDFTPKS